MIWIALACFSLLCAVIPTAMYLANRRLFLIAPTARSEAEAAMPVSVLIPARNEAERIGATIDALLAQSTANLEVVVLDDHSEDQTAQIVTSYGAAGQPVRLVRSKPLPAGWNGKQHACYQLADAASYEHILFLDADVQMLPTGIERLRELKSDSCPALLSAFPKQLTGTIAEQAIVPLMHYILLGFLPFRRMRQSTHPAYAAGCGQLFFTTKADYRLAGTHAILRSSRHDGIKLPKAYRQAGLSTDVVDGTEIAMCRMYQGTAEVIRGVLKNADEGLANPKAIVPFSVLLLGSTLLPVVVFFGAWKQQQWLAMVIATLAIVVVLVPRVLATRDLRQSWVSAVLHIPAIIGFVLLQWFALVLSLLGRKVKWKNR